MKGKPLKAEAATQKSRAHAERRVQSASTPGQVLGAALDYLRAALRRSHSNPQVAGLADDIAAQLLDAAQRLDATYVDEARLRKEARDELQPQRNGHGR